jgi:guanyl-specific ribonuclease Sa
MRKFLWDQRTFAGAVILLLLGSLLINTFRDDDGSSSSEEPVATPTVNLEPDDVPSGSADGDDDPTLPTGDEPTSTATDPGSGLSVVALSELPAEAEETAQLIAADGPFPYEDDGETFLNSAEGLPARESGYYKVYTVPSSESGEPTTRRLITGEGRELYWTDDLYETFVRVDPAR